MSIREMLEFKIIPNIRDDDILQIYNNLVINNS